MVSPPGLMDDVDAVQAQIARNMLDSGDWVTARLDGVKYLEKAPLKYWLLAVSYMIFGVSDQAARFPVALSAVLLCWVVARFAVWAFHDERAGLWAGLSLATCVGLFLFTRILIPDVMVTLTITLTLWGLLRALDGDEPRPRRWALVMWAAMGCGLLLKGLIAVVFPAGAAFFYLLFTRQIFSGRTWRRMEMPRGLLLLLAIALPWHVLATLRNPPYFDFTLRSEHGQYRGFFWFYFLNEHVLRFLNLRYPRDYNTVPRLWFWLFHLIWFFPWSAYLPAAATLGYRGADRGSRARLMALCWAGVVMVFFTFSTTQEYYSMPAYPAVALLLGCAIAGGGALVRWGTRAAGTVAALAAAAIAFILWSVRGIPAPGDISAALRQNPELYTLSLGHAADLTLHSFAYLRLPLLVAGVAFLIGAVGAWRWTGRRSALLSLAIMMALFFHAARLALVAFEPYLGSRPLAEALVKQPEGRLIVDDQYYAFSSVFFYANRTALLLNGRVQNLIYGSFAPGAPDVFIDDGEFARLWSSPERHYLVAPAAALPRLEKLAGPIRVIAASGGKVLAGNIAPAAAAAPRGRPEVRFLCFAPSPYTGRHDSLRAGLGILLSLRRVIEEHGLSIDTSFYDGIPVLEDGARARALLRGPRVVVVGTSTWAQGSPHYIRRYFELANNESLLGASASAWATAGGSGTGGELVIEDALRTLMGMGAQTFSLGQKYMVFTTGERFSPREGQFTALDCWYMEEFAKSIALAALGGGDRAQTEALAAKLGIRHEYWRNFPKSEAAIADRYRALRERLNAAAEASSPAYEELRTLVRTP